MTLTWIIIDNKIKKVWKGTFLELCYIKCENLLKKRTVIFEKKSQYLPKKQLLLNYSKYFREHFV